MAVFSPLSLENRESRAVRIRGCHLSRQKSTGRIVQAESGAGGLEGGGEGEQTGNQTTHMHIAHQHLK